MNITLDLERRPPSCYKFEMSKTVERWMLFQYVHGELTPLSKPFQTRKQAEKAREKYPGVCARGLDSV